MAHWDFVPYTKKSGMKMTYSAVPGTISGMGLKFEGLIADKHMLDAIEYSKALDGNSRLFRLVAHYCYHGTVLSGREKSDLKCYALPSKCGSYESLLLILPALAHEIPAFSDVYKTSLDWLISKIMGYIKNSLSGQDNMESLIETINSRAETDRELNTILANGLVKANNELADSHKRLIETLPQLVKAAEPSLSKSIAPIGTSCSSLSQFHDSEEPIIISEAEAEAIRSKKELRTGNANEYKVLRFHSLNIDTGICTVDLEGYDNIINGKVTDIIVSEPENPYTTALNTHQPLVVRARPIYKGQEIHKIYITETT